jgi:spore photoproduct lyase
VDLIYIDPLAADTIVAHRVRRAGLQIVEGNPPSDLLNHRGDLSARQFGRSKRIVHVTPFKGQFFKRCPGARPGLVCCNYFVLNLGLQCNFNCSYCYLQSFINTPIMKIYSNLEVALQELRAMGRDLAESSLRVGTGEVIDSLSLDPWTLYSRDLIRFFRDYPKWRLEFKTKSDFVDQFLDEPHAGNVIVSWSINPEKIVTEEEHGTAPLARRLQAARRARDRGFLLSFHMDPMIWHDGWEKSYGEMADQVMELFTPEDIPYLSVGALRFQPEQRQMMLERFPASSSVNRAELFRSQDGKLRYDAGLRQAMFQFIFDRFKGRDPRWNIFMCMETPDTWLSGAYPSPRADAGLKDLFDHRVTIKVQKNLDASTESEVGSSSTGARQ